CTGRSEAPADPRRLLLPLRDGGGGERGARAATHLLPQGAWRRRSGRELRDALGPPDRVASRRLTRQLSVAPADASRPSVLRRIEARAARPPGGTGFASPAPPGPTQHEARRMPPRASGRCDHLRPRRTLSRQTAAESVSSVSRAARGSRG